MQQVLVPVESSWWSKINWTQWVSLLASILTVYGIPMDAPTQAAVVLGIQSLQTVLTWVLRTWFTNTVTPGSLSK